MSLETLTERAKKLEALYGQLRKARHEGRLPRYYQLPPAIAHAVSWAQMERAQETQWWRELKHESESAMYALSATWASGEHLLDDLTVEGILRYRAERLWEEELAKQAEAEIAAETNIPQWMVW